MKSLKRLLSVIIAFAMMFSMSAFAADFGDVSADNTFKEAIDVLSDLGIVKGYEDGNYKPEKEVTRAEMTSLLMRMINLSITGITVPESYYSDVPNNHWAVYDINTASDRKIVSGYGDGAFGPDSPVTFEQAVKMIVCILGYESRATNKDDGYDGWPNGYMRVGRELGITNKCEMTQNQPAPRGVIAQLLYNSLEVQIMEKSTSSESYKITDDTLLGTYLKITKSTGKVIANSKTRLDNTESVVKDDEIQIEGSNGIVTRYQIGTNADAVDMLGLDVLAYSKMDDTNSNNILLHIEPRTAVKTLTVDAEDIMSFTSGKLTYEVGNNGRMNDAAIASGAKYLYNDKYIDASALFGNSLQIPQIGSVTLTDSGAGYSLVNITSYKNYVVKTVDVNNSRVYVDTAITPGDSYIDVPVDNTLEWSISIKKNDSATTLSGIKKGNIISVKSSHASQTAGIKVMEVLVSDKKVTGKVTAEEEDFITIASKDYSIAKSLESITAITDKIEYGVSGTFYLDAFGKIANVEFGASETFNDAYLIRAATTGNPADLTLTLKVLDAKSKSVKNLTCAPKVTVDGQFYSDLNTVLNQLDLANANTNLDGGTNSQYSQPIRYMLNSSGLVSEINTTSTVNDPTDNFKLVPDFDIAGFNSTFPYNTNRYFTMSNNKQLKINTSTVVYLVPTDRSEDNKYIVRTYSHFINGDKYKIEAFNANDNNEATVVVVYDTGDSDKVRPNSPIFLVENKTSVNTEDGVKTKLTGYEFSTGASAEYIVENDSSIASLELTKGDIIRFAPTTEGYIGEKVFLYFDASEVAGGTSYGNDTRYSNNSNAAFLEPTNFPYRYVATSANTSNFYLNNNNIAARDSRRLFLLGTPISITTSEDGTISLNYTDRIPGVDADFDARQEVGYTIASSTHVFVYDSAAAEANRLTYVPASDTAQKESYLLTTKTYDIAANDADQIYIYGLSETLRTLYIIK